MSLKGQQITINKQSDGNGHITSGRTIKQEIVADYGDGTVRTTSGDVWRVKGTSGGLVGY